MDSKEVILKRFYELLSEGFGGRKRMNARFWQLCAEAKNNSKSTHFSRLNRVELNLVIEAFTPPKPLAFEEYLAKHPSCYTIDKMLEDAEYDPDMEDI